MMELEIAVTSLCNDLAKGGVVNDKAWEDIKKILADYKEEAKFEKGEKIPVELASAVHTIKAVVSRQENLIEDEQFLNEVYEVIDEFYDDWPPVWLCE